MANFPFTKVLTPVFRAKFVQVFELHSYKLKSGEMTKPCYSVKAVWTPALFSEQDKVRWQNLQGVFDKAAMFEFNTSWADMHKMQNVYRVGLYSGEMAKGDGFGPGTMYANLTNEKERPVVLDLQDNPVGPEYGNAARVFDGCYMRAEASVFPYSNAGKGISMRLLFLRLLRGLPQDKFAMFSAGDEIAKAKDEDAMWDQGAPDPFA